MEKLTVDGFTYDTIRDSITHVVWTGKATEAAIRTLTQLGHTAATQHGGRATRRLLIDASKGTGIDRGARRQMADLGRNKPWDRVAFVGARFEVEVLLGLVIKAIQLLKMEVADVAFVDTVEQGVAWLERE